MASVTKPHGDFVNNVDVANASYVDDQFNTLYNLVNGGLDSANAPSLGYAVTVISATATLTSSQVGIIECTAGANGITLTLPSAATTGLRFILKKVDSGAGVVAINTTSSQTVDGQLNRSLVNQYAEIHVISNGSNWDVIIENIVDLPTFSMSRQALINGNFDVWQRGPSFNVSGTSYIADRWCTANVNGTASKQNFAPGQTNVPNEPSAYLNVTQSVATSFSSIQQRIEDVRSFAGKQISKTFYAKSSAANPIKFISIIQNFGSGGSASVETAFKTTDTLLTTLWQKITVTGTVPSIAGKTIGANSYLAILLYGSTGVVATFNIDIAQVQVNAGDTALPFQPRSFAEELTLCQRYYEKSYDVDTLPGTANTNGSIVGDAEGFVSTNPTFNNVSFKVRKRIPPTVTIYGTSGALNTINDTVADRTLGSGNFVASISQAGFRQDYTLTGATNARRQFNYTADAEL